MSYFSVIIYYYIFDNRQLYMYDLGEVFSPIVGASKPSDEVRTTNGLVGPESFHQ